MISFNNWLKVKANESSDVTAFGGQKAPNSDDFEACQNYFNPRRRKASFGMHVTSPETETAPEDDLNVPPLHGYSSDTGTHTLNTQSKNPNLVKDILLAKRLEGELAAVRKRIQGQ